MISYSYIKEEANGFKRITVRKDIKTGVKRIEIRSYLPTPIQLVMVVNNNEIESTLLERIS